MAAAAMKPPSAVAGHTRPLPPTSNLPEPAQHLHHLSLHPCPQARSAPTCTARTAPHSPAPARSATASGARWEACACPASSSPAATSATVSCGPTGCGSFAAVAEQQLCSDAVPASASLADQPAPVIPARRRRRPLHRVHRRLPGLRQRALPELHRPAVHVSGSREGTERGSPKHSDRADPCTCAAPGSPLMRGHRPARSLPHPCRHHLLPPPAVTAAAPAPRGWTPATVATGAPRSRAESASLARRTAGECRPCPLVAVVARPQACHALRRAGGGGWGERALQPA